MFAAAGGGLPNPPFLLKNERSGLGRESESRRPPSAAAAAAAPEITSGNAKRQKNAKKEKTPKTKNAKQKLNAENNIPHPWVVVEFFGPVGRRS